MATESPIRMVEARGKWGSHKGAGVGAYPPVTRMPVDEEVLLVNGHKFRGRRGTAPNRSGSAPPNMEGSLAAIENLMQNSVLSANITTLSYDWDCRGPRGQLVSYLSPDMNYSSAIGLIPQFHKSAKLCSDQYLSRGFLPTHKEEPEDDRSPQKSSDNVADKNAAVWSGQDSSSSSDQARGVSEPTKELPADDVASLSYDSRQGSSPSIQYEDDAVRASENKTPVSGDANVTNLQSRFKALKVSCPPNVENQGGRGERQQSFQGNLLPHQMFHQSGNFQYQGSGPQVASQGTDNSYVVADQYFHGQLPSPEVHSSSFIHPVYAAAPATYMQSPSPYYFGVQPPGVLYPSQYGIGGFSYNANMHPSFMAGYPPHTTVPDVNIQVPGSWENGSQGFDVHEMNRFYGQHGFAPPSMDPRLQFYHTFGDMYTAPGQIDPMSFRGGVIGNHVGGLPGASDHIPQHLGVGVQIDVSQRRGVSLGADHCGNSVNMGFYMSGPNSSLASPVPGSPIGGNGILGGRSDVSSPNAGLYAGWQGQRGYENSNYQKPYSILEELKSGKGRRFELSDIAGHVVEFSVDQHGSRFIQQKLENCSVEDKASVFQEVVPHACTLMTDVFGNYVIQKFLEYGTRYQRRDLAKAFTGQILPLSLQMYGCRVIQKALDVIELDQKIELVRELDGHVMRCVRDQNGNHVVQKCIECVPSERIGFIIAAFHGQIASLSMHPYGCRVIQRVLEHCTDELQSQFIVDEILESVCSLAQDQYGNYVTQHILERGKPQERGQIIKNLCGQVVKMSQHKFASNVIEKCLEYGDAPSRELIIHEVVGQDEGNDNLLVMMKDQYANYVVQKILEKCAEDQRELLLDRVQVHLNALKKYTYGKHIVARFEQLFGEISASTA